MTRSVDCRALAIRVLRRALQEIEAMPGPSNRLDRWRVSVVKPGPREGPNWQIQIRPPRWSAKKLKRRSSRTTDRAKAEAMARELEAELNEEQARGPLVAELLQAYEVHTDKRHLAGEVSWNTLKSVATSRRRLEKVMGPVRLADLDEESLAELRRRLLAEGYKLNTINLTLAHLRAAWAWGRRSGLHSLGELKRPPRIGAKVRRTLHTGKRPYTPLELQRVLAHESPYHLSLRVLAESGARTGEVCALDCRDLYQDDNGRWWIRIRDPKVGLPRTVPILEDTAQLLLAEVGDRTARDPLFRIQGSERRITTAAVFGSLAKILDDLGLRTPVSEGSPGGRRRKIWDLDTHSIRRAWIAHADRAGIPMVVRARIVGHEITGVHDGYQRHYTGDDLHEAVLRVRAWREEEASRAVRSPDAAGLCSSGGGEYYRRMAGLLDSPLDFPGVASPSRHAGSGLPLIRHVRDVRGLVGWELLLAALEREVVRE